jgi:hypothetical protein
LRATHQCRGQPQLDFGLQRVSFDAIFSDTSRSGLALRRSRVFAGWTIEPFKIFHCLVEGRLRLSAQCRVVRCELDFPNEKLAMLGSRLAALENQPRAIAFVGGGRDRFVDDFRRAFEELGPIIASRVFGVFDIRTGQFDRQLDAPLGRKIGPSEFVQAVDFGDSEQMPPPQLGKIPRRLFVGRTRRRPNDKSNKQDADTMDDAPPPPDWPGEAVR